MVKWNYQDEYRSCRNSCGVGNGKKIRDIVFVEYTIRQRLYALAQMLLTQRLQPMVTTRSSVLLYPSED